MYSILWIASCFYRDTYKTLITRTAINIWKNKCGGGKDSSSLLLTQLGIYKGRDDPYDDPYIEGTHTPTSWWSSIELKKGEDHIKKLALKMHAIMPHNANCERVFSILGWFLGKRRTK